ncbi:phenylacetate--CoA ligase family protein [Nitriliruptor alkaliphilus]|uniref:phenylacetate--CoA ligase family protein n=1 Tax=Nitriliruptor alkaliphilus TaxID=427918 RepID=UPI001B80A492|nr:hypothetical protein [Nitriliruptor alkaliphilus]
MRASYFYSRNWDAFAREWQGPAEYVNGLWVAPRERIEDVQQERFRSVLEYGWSNPWYGQRWREHGIEPGDVRGLEDLSRLPTFNVDDLRESINASPPFGSHQGIGFGQGEPIKIQTSGGTTSKPRPTFFTPFEMEMQGVSMARALYLHGAAPGDRIQIPTTLSMANLGWAYYTAAFHWMGMVPITTGTGNVTSSKRQLEIAFDWGTNIWGSFPEYLTRLAQVAEEEGLHLPDLPTKFLSTYLGPDTEGKLREALEEAWGAPVYDNYGAHEIGHTSIECMERDGLHIFEDLVYFEVVDVDTGKPLPEGEKGKLVATSLYRRYPPIIRYDLNDVTRILPGECRCGSHTKRMDHFLGRSDDMVKIRGVNVFPMAALGAVRSRPDTTGEWVCIVNRIDRGQEIRDELSVQVEYRDGASLEDFKRDLESRLHDSFGIRVEVEPVPAGSLAEYTYAREGKARRLIDNRFS